MINEEEVVKLLDSVDIDEMIDNDFKNFNNNDVICEYAKLSSKRAVLTYKNKVMKNLLDKCGIIHN